MKKIFSIALVFLLAAVLVACNGGRELPTLEVPLDITVKVGERVDLTKNIEALDQDGLDISEFLTFSVDDTTVEIDGKFLTASQIGSFIVTTTLTDSKDKDLEVSKKFFVEVIAGDEVVEGKVTTYTFDELSEEALRGFTVSEGELTVSGGELVYEGVSNASLNKAFVLNADSEYTISLRVKASTDLTGVNLSLKGLDVNTTVDLGTEYQNIELTVNTTLEVETNLVLAIESESAYTLNVQELYVKTSSGLEDASPALTDFAYFNDKGESTMEIIDEQIVIDITDNNAGIWEQKLLLEHVQLIPNKSYVLSYTIEANNEINYEFIARVLDQQAGERDENYIWSAPKANKDEVKVVSHVFRTNDTDINDFEMFFQVGNQASPTEIKIYDITLEYYSVFDESTDNFSGVSDFASFEGEEADASLYIDLDAKALVYDVKVFGAVDWHNKLFLEDVLFEQDSRYEVSFVAKASKATELFFAVNPMGQWDPKVAEMVNLSTDYQEYTFTTDSFQSFDQKFEILFQLGSFNEGETVISFESFTITQLVRK